MALQVQKANLSPKDFRLFEPTWCPRCGDFAVLASLQRVAARRGLDPDHTVIVGGIGCSGKIASFFRAYGFHGVHGRVLPVATGIKLANRELTVIAAGGDGDGYGIGLSHFLHAIRRNPDITYIVMDNQTYGLTKGQASPTSGRGYQTKANPVPVAEDPLNPLALALAAGCGFVAQGFSGWPKQLEALLEGALDYRGFALVNVLSPCVTFNTVNTYEWYQARLLNLDEREGYNPLDRDAAFRAVLETRGLVTGLVYRDPERVPLEDALPGFGAAALAFQELELPAEVKERLLQEFAA